MQIRPTPKVASVNFVDGNVQVAFEDGFTATFTPALLFASRNLARIMNDEPYDGDLVSRYDEG